MAEAKGRIEGEYAAHKKKSIMEKLDEHLGKMIDRLEFKDILDCVAAAGLTPVIHEAIIASVTVGSILEKAQVTATGALIGTAIFPGLGTLAGGIIGFVVSNFLPQPAGQEISVSGLIPPSQVKPFLEWLLSFSIAWCIVKWGDKMIGIGITSLAGIGSLLGVTL